VIKLEDEMCATQNWKQMRVFPARIWLQGQTGKDARAINFDSNLVSPSVAPPVHCYVSFVMIARIAVKQHKSWLTCLGYAQLKNALKRFTENLADPRFQRRSNL